MMFNWREIRIFCILNTRHLHSYDLRDNLYTNANFEKVLPITPKDIYHFVNTIYHA